MPKLIQIRSSQRVFDIKIGNKIFNYILLGIKSLQIIELNCIECSCIAHINTTDLLLDVLVSTGGPADCIYPFKFSFSSNFYYRTFDSRCYGGFELLGEHTAACKHLAMGRTPPLTNFDLVNFQKVNVDFKNRYTETNKNVQKVSLPKKHYVTAKNSPLSPDKLALQKIISKRDMARAKENKTKASVTIIVSED